ncbi:MAG: hypothetical protein IPN42_14800 [Methylococcaceae bacterium]|nr:hypothetical protein [Methylococcaceae bacterium]
MNSKLKGILCLVFALTINGCSTIKTSDRNPITSQSTNPYLKYLSPEPYWHYNFYPEPRWEYSYGLYSYPDSPSALAFQCHELDKPYWGSKHHRNPPQKKPKPVKPVIPAEIPPKRPPVTKPVAKPPKDFPKPIRHISQPPVKPELTTNLKMKPISTQEMPITRLEKPPKKDAPVISKAIEKSKQVLSDKNSRNRLNSPEELEKPPSMKTESAKEESSLHQSQSEVFPVVKENKSAGRIPSNFIESTDKSLNNPPAHHETRKALSESNRNNSAKNNIKSNVNNGEIVDRKHEKLTESSTTKSAKRTEETARPAVDKSRVRDNVKDELSNQQKNSSIPRPDKDNQSFPKIPQSRAELETQSRMNGNDKPQQIETPQRRPEPVDKQVNEAPIRRDQPASTVYRPVPEPRIPVEPKPSREERVVRESPPERQEPPKAAPLPKPEPESRPAPKPDPVKPDSPAPRNNPDSPKKR